LRDDIAKPSASRTIGQATISVSSARSLANLADDSLLLRVLAPEVCVSRQDDLEQSLDHRGNAAEMSRPDPPLELVAQASTLTTVRNPGGYISSTVGAKRTSAPACSSSLRSASNARGYFAKSSLGPNCLGLTKNRNNHRARLASGGFHQGEMAGVQSSHRGNKADNPALGPRLARRLLHPFNRADQLHEKGTRRYFAACAVARSR